GAIASRRGGQNRGDEVVVAVARARAGGRARIGYCFHREAVLRRTRQRTVLAEDWRRWEKGRTHINVFLRRDGQKVRLPGSMDTDRIVNGVALEKLLLPAHGMLTLRKNSSPGDQGDNLITLRPLIEDRAELDREAGQQVDG
ncbi:unnamed protein product, partial [Ectocarpus sp. 8 AP-2014]